MLGEHKNHTMSQPAQLSVSVGSCQCQCLNSYPSQYQGQDLSKLPIDGSKMF